MFLIIEKCTHGDVRLSGGYKYYGQVQVCFNGRWEAIYGYIDVHSNITKVVCQQLGFSYSG